MKSILILSDAFYPEIRSSTKILSDLCDYLRKKNFSITVITFHQEKKKTIKFAKDYYVNYLSNKNYRNKNFFIRGLKTLSLPVKIIFFVIKNLILKKQKKNYDYIYIYSPPTTIALAGILLKSIFKSKVILNIQDIFPENAKDLGIIKSNYLFNIFKLLSKIIYRKSHFIFVHSKGNLQFLKKFYFQETQKKLFISNNWYKLNKIKSETKLSKNDFFPNQKPIMVFSGIMGPSQYFEHIINLNKIDSINQKYNFLIISEGSHIKKLKVSVLKNSFNNFKFLKFVDDETLRKIFSICDYGLITLSFSNKTPVVPGKLMIYSACGLPSVCIVNMESDLNEIIPNFQSGYIVNNNNKCYQVLANKLVDTNYSDYLNLHKNSLVMFREMYDADKILNQLFDLIEKN